MAAPVTVTVTVASDDGGMKMTSKADPVDRFDTGVAHTARVYNYWLGGKDHFEADRAAGDFVRERYPNVITGVRAQRAFLARAVRYLVAEAGIRQFLDIGTGLPTANNTHEVAQQIAPETRVVYVDNDPIVLAHARALLDSRPEGATAYIDADLRDTSAILEEADRVLDFGRPVGVMMLGILHSIPDADDPYALVDTVLDAVPAASHLTVSHIASDVDEKATETMHGYNERDGGDHVTPRSHAQVSRFFEGLDLIEPGVVQLHRWRPDAEAHPDAGAPGTGLDIPNYGAMGRKP